MSQLLAKLQSQHGLPLLDANNYEQFVYSHADVVLFFSHDPTVFPESHDVAVILPELLKAFSGRLQAAVISRVIERELQARFHFTTWPALIFLRNGEYLGVITGIKNWQEYLQEITQMLVADVTEPPKFDLDKACGSQH